MVSVSFNMRELAGTRNFKQISHKFRFNRVSLYFPHFFLLEENILILSAKGTPVLYN